MRWRLRVRQSDLLVPSKFAVHVLSDDSSGWEGLEGLKGDG